MKKTIFLFSFILFLLSILIFEFDFAFQKYSYDIVAGNHQEIHIVYHQETSLDDIINALKQFSIDHNVNISQYTFLDEETIHIYSTYLPADSGIRLIHGMYPKGGEFISNKQTTENPQSGYISSPPTQLDYKFYSIDQINNVGLRGDFYMASSDLELARALEKILYPLGDVQIAPVQVNLAYFVNVSLLLLVFFTFIIYIITVLFYVFSENKSIYLEQLWGYSSKEIFLRLLTPFFKPIACIIGVLVSVLAIFIIYYQQIHFVIVYLALFILAVLISLIVGAAISLMTLKMICQSGLSSVDLKEKLPFKNYAMASVIIKFVVTFVFLMINVFSIHTLLNLNKQLKTTEYWEVTKDIYQVTAKYSDTSNDLVKERARNNCLSDFYNALNEEKSAILIEAQNFSNMSTDVNHPKYLYELNTNDNLSASISTGGRNITINQNYLDFNPIISVNGNNAKEEIKYDRDTLILLVPEKLQQYEEKIQENFRELFYFQRVEIANMYNKEAGQALDTTSIDDLHVHIIYVKNNQEYFPFYTDLGDLDNNNMVVDPIAIIYHPTVDTSFIAAYVTSSLYFVDTHKGEAYTSLKEILVGTDALQYIPSVISVYQEKGKEISALKQKIVQQITALILMLIISICCIIVFAWCYYIPNAKTMYLRLLFGYSHWYRNKKMYLTVLITNMIAGIAVYMAFLSIISVYAIVVLLLFDIFITFFMEKMLQEKYKSAILKGDSL
ncbi:bacteriocin-associated integral membrane protein [Alkalibaculum bacchi]|uniref:Bacteriocin-associated integral membrane protein n=1 Tax=Alkalibaculum bacchi TaxID=645887 RepID=A0A366HZ97_9FIRM|nr:DUF1430 domain-containing protein [Alkalibaculum bacchi]RBP58762.1 bacteriocin-associated integral membrane protein [Alkalibaculum bacchi]